jgi:hypothetical protein
LRSFSCATTDYFCTEIFQRNCIFNFCAADLNTSNLIFRVRQYASSTPDHIRFLFIFVVYHTTNSTPKKGCLSLYIKEPAATTTVNVNLKSHRLVFFICFPQATNAAIHLFPSFHLFRSLLITCGAHRPCLPFSFLPSAHPPNSSLGPATSSSLFRSLLSLRVDAM